MSESEGFLGRWSRRKRAASATPAPAPAPSPGPETPAAAPPPAVAAEPEFDPASLPPVESLTADSDITAFLRPQVPAALRTAALRRAWTLDPAIRDYIGPADYAWDYNAPDGMAGFALDLGGDVKRLLAQAIGLVEEDTPKPPAAPDDPGPAAPPAEAPPALLAEVASSPLAEATRPSLAEPVPAPALPDAAGPAPVAAAPPAPPPRRHGGARPV